MKAITFSHCVLTCVYIYVCPPQFAIYCHRSPRFYLLHTAFDFVLSVCPPIMSHSPNTFCSFSCVLEIVQSPSSPCGNSLEIATCMDGTVYSDVPTLSNPDLIGIRVNYFNASKNYFPVCSLVFCQGTMTVLESVSNDPVLSVRATSLLRYYMPPYFFQFSYSSTYSCPGDHTAVDYYEKCPPQNASVSFVGRVIATKTAGGRRFFSVQVTAFKPRDNGESSYETFHLVCLMAPDIRWGRVKFPSMNSYVQAMGNASNYSSFLCFADPI